MWGVIVNAVGIAAGGFIGLLIRKNIPDRLVEAVMSIIGLMTTLIGLQGALASENIMVLLVSLVIGTLIGTAFCLQERLETSANNIQKRLGSKDNQLVEGFMTAVLVHCVGAMAILGSFEAGINGNYEVLYVKSALDFISTIIFASTYGVGALFSSVAILIYQGSLVLMATQIQAFLTPVMINEISAVGSVIVFALGLNLLKLKSFKVVDLLPAMLGPILYFGFMNNVLNLL